MTRILSLIIGIVMYQTCIGQIDTSLCEMPDVNAEFKYKNCKNTVECIRQFVYDNALWPTQDDLICSIYIECIIEKDGRITQTKIIRGYNDKFNEASLEVVRKMPNWIPAQKNGINVRTKVYIPVRWEM